MNKNELITYLDFFDNEHEIEFRLSERDKKQTTLLIPKSKEIHHKDSIVNHLVFEKEEREILYKEEIPIIFSFGSRLVKLTRLVYEDKSVEYKETIVTQEYKNDPFPNGFH